MDRYIALNQLEMETQVIVNFNTEYSVDLYRQQIDLPEDLTPLILLHSVLYSYSHPSLLQYKRP